MKRLHELVPSAKSDMSVRAIYMKGARLLHPAREVVIRNCTRS